MSQYCMYLRKSRADSEQESLENVLARHCRILQEIAKNRLGAPIPEECIFREIVSGENISDRPEMRNLLGIIQTQNVSGVLVVDPQRLSRGDLSDCGTVIRYFRYTSTPIITPARIYDLTDRFDRKFFEMELMRGSDYLEYVKEIMLRGRIASVKEGNFIGSIPPYGYEKRRIGKSFTLVPCQESEIIERIFKMWTEDSLSISEIAERLNKSGILPRKSDKWSGATIRDILRNPVYTGVIRWNHRKTVKKFLNGQLITSRPLSTKEQSITVPDSHAAIISHETFQRSLNRFGSTSRLRKSKELRNPFAGVIRCQCGKSLVFQLPATGSPRLHCSAQKTCGNRSILFKLVETELLNIIRIYSEITDISLSEKIVHLLSDTTTPALCKNLLYRSFLNNVVFRRKTGDLPTFSLVVSFR